MEEVDDDGCVNHIIEEGGTDDGPDDILSLRKQVKSLTERLGTINVESTDTIVKLEKKIKEQQTFNENVMKIIEDMGLSKQLNSTIDSDLKYSRSLSENEEDAFESAASSTKKSTTSCTQTNLVIDPETSIKLSFVSAGISSYSTSTAEFSMGKNTLTSTPSSINDLYGPRSSKQTREDSQRLRTNQIPPISLNQDFNDQPAHSHEIAGDHEDTDRVSPTVDLKNAGRPPTFPSNSTPSKQAMPLKSILRTPTHEKSSGPLSSFSPSLSPIHSTPHMSEIFQPESEEKQVHSSTIFDDSHVDAMSHKSAKTEREKGGILGESIFMSPLRYDSSDGDGSLHSISMLNVTSNTSLASGIGSRRRPFTGDRNHDNSDMNASLVPKKKKSPSRRRRLSGDSDSQFQEGDANSSGTSGEDTFSRKFYTTPTKNSSSNIHSPRSSNSKTNRLNSLGFVKVYSASDSKLNSSFWKERLGKRHLTSVLGSPLSQKLF